MHLIRYRGTLAPNTKRRSHIVPAEPIPDGKSAEATEDEKDGRYYIQWALTHIHVPRGTWTSYPGDAASRRTIQNAP